MVLRPSLQPQRRFLEGQNFDMELANITLAQAERVKEQGEQGEVL